MVKHYFNPNAISEAENILYDKIVMKLSDQDKAKVESALTFDVSLAIKPVKGAKGNINEDDDTDI